ncbi:hypothetical protein D9757_006883 [Collybiopsis confluens]|uniref:Uncharacterized protein n=1 Tax=Collybiopsis confluens TaxID=2823264 RepID=A0A8H5HPN0_9AGAR|nr:hypothetical protein D9757_006883 [Collybiopsis confluens]
MQISSERGDLYTSPTLLTLDNMAGAKRLVTVKSWSSILNLIIGDTLVIWRAWAVWHGNKWMRWVWIVSAICNAVFIFLTVTVWKGVVNGLDENFGMAFEGTFYLLFSLTLNVLATVAIAYKAKGILEYDPLRLDRSTNMFGKVRYHGETRVQKILWVMVDSGVVFCIMQGVYFAMIISGSLSREDSEYSTPFRRFDDIIGPSSSIVLNYIRLLQVLLVTTNFRSGNISSSRTSSSPSVLGNISSSRRSRSAALGNISSSRRCIPSALGNISSSSSALGNISSSRMSSPSALGNISSSRRAIGTI